MTPIAPQRGSPARYVISVVCLIAAMVALAGGFLQMVRSLERGGYGTSAINVALGWLGLGGGLLAFGIALMIWELSIRHNVRH